MILSSKEIKKIYHSRYKDLTEIFVLDPIVTCPSFKHMQDIVLIVRKNIQNLKFKKNKMDCDDFSLIMNAKVHEYRYNESIFDNNEEDNYQYSFGEVFIEKEKALFGSKYHFMNSFIDEQLRLFFVESQTGRIYEQGSSDDNVKKVLHVRI